MKKLSFIRWQGFIPFIIIGLLIYVFTTIYMDSLLKRLIVKNATYYNGALVEIKSLRLSFLTSSLRIKGLQIANPDNLMQNRAQIENIVFDFRFLPLLKKKFVTEEINVSGVKWLTKRESEGKIPESWQKQWERESKEKSSISPIIADAFSKLKDSVKAELPDISVDSLKKKFDPRSIKLEELESYKKVFQIKSNAQNSYNKFQDSTNNLISEQKKFVSETKKKIDALNPKNLNTPQSVINALNTVQSFQNDIKKQKALVGSRIYEVSAEAKTLTSALNDVPNLIKNDTKSIVDKYSFGSFNLKNFSRQIFGGNWIPYFQKYSQLTAQAKAYQKKFTKGKVKEEKPQRFKGLNIVFPVTDGIPRFLIQKISMSAQANRKETSNEIYRGEYKLDIADISSDQKLYGKPTTADASLTTYDGIFSKAAAALLLDYRDTPAKDNLKLEIQKFKLAGVTMGKGSAFPLPLKEGFANAEVSGGTEEQKLKFRAALNIAGAKYDFKKSSNYILELLQEIVTKIDKFRVDMELSGTVKEPSLKITSTLDNAIASGIEKVFAEKLNEIRTKAEKYIRDEVTKNISTAKAEIDKFKGKIEGPLMEQGKNMDALSGQAKNRIEELKKKQKGLAGSKIKGLLK